MTGLGVEIETLADDAQEHVPPIHGEQAAAATAMATKIAEMIGLVCIAPVSISLRISVILQKYEIIGSPPGKALLMGEGNTLLEQRGCEHLKVRPPGRPAMTGALVLLVAVFDARLLQIAKGLLAVHVGDVGRTALREAQDLEIAVEFGRDFLKL